MCRVLPRHAKRFWSDYAAVGFVLLCFDVVCHVKHFVPCQIDPRRVGLVYASLGCAKHFALRLVQLRRVQIR